MNSGLYTRPGVSATASVAAWANLLPAPITNVSNVYLALKDLGARAFRTDSAPCAAAPFPEFSPGPATLTTREVSWPTTSSSASSSSGLKRLSMYSLAKVLGTEISSWSSWRATGRMPSNQTLSEETSMCSEARSKTSVQTCSALPTTYLTQALMMASTRSLPSGEMRRLPDSSAMTSPCSSRTERSLYAVLTLISSRSATVEGPTSPHSKTVMSTFCCLSEMFIRGTPSGYLLCGGDGGVSLCSTTRSSPAAETVATVPPPMLSSMVRVPPTFSAAARAMPSPAPTPRISPSASGAAPEKPNSIALLLFSTPGPLSETRTTLPSSRMDMTTPR